MQNFTFFEILRLFLLEYFTLAVFVKTYRNIWFSVFFNFVLYSAFSTFFYSSATDGSFVEKKCASGAIQISTMVSMMSLFTTTWSMPLFVKILFPEGITSLVVSTYVLTWVIIDMIVINCLQNFTFFKY